MLNTRTALLFLLTSTAVLTVSCAPSEKPDTRAADAAALQSLDEKWSATAGKNDLDGTLAFYADGAVLLPPNAPIATDKKSIRDAWASMLGPGTAISWKVSKSEAAASGDLGYVYGSYVLDIKDPKGGPATHDQGKFLEVWKKQADGNWKCIVDTFNSDLPPAPMPAEVKK